MTKFTIHPVCGLLPLMEGDEFDALVADIDKNGQLEAIILDKDNRIIDGRNRFRACEQLGIEPRARLFKYDDDEIPAYVMSKNVHRRHLNTGQRAMVAAELTDLMNTKGGGDHRLISGGAISKEAAAKLLKVGKSSVEAARKVKRTGSPELNKAVAEGKIAPSRAAKLADVPKDEHAEKMAGKKKAEPTLQQQIDKACRLILSIDEEHYDEFFDGLRQKSEPFRNWVADLDSRSTKSGPIRRRLPVANGHEHPEE